LCFNRPRGSFITQKNNLGCDNETLNTAFQRSPGEKSKHHHQREREVRRVLIIIIIIIIIPKEEEEEEEQ
jgi:hypothetical protein